MVGGGAEIQVLSGYVRYGNAPPNSLQIGAPCSATAPTGYLSWSTVDSSVMQQPVNRCKQLLPVHHEWMISELNFCAASNASLLNCLLEREFDTLLEI